MNKRGNNLRREMRPDPPEDSTAWEMARRAVSCFMRRVVWRVHNNRDLMPRRPR